MKSRGETGRKIYLVRHGRVAFPGNIRRCIGRTNLPLNREGILEAENLAAFFAGHPVERVFTSPLLRCRKTAEILAGGSCQVNVREGLLELDMGEWENVPMQELKKELESEPKTGEGRAAGLKRMLETMEEIRRDTPGDIVCVAHAGINCCYLSHLMGTPLDTSRALPQPYGGYSCIEEGGDGTLMVTEIGKMPARAPGPLECEELWERCQTPPGVREHCKRVAQRALCIGESLNRAGCGLDLELILSGALLHDVVRHKSSHAMEGAKLLEHEGYPEVAGIILSHHDLEPEDTAPTEAEVVCLADKLVSGTQTVTLEERFALSRKKCQAQPDSGKALELHESRYRQAKRIEKKFQGYMEKTW